MLSPSLTPVGPVWQGAAAGGTERLSPRSQSSPTEGGFIGGVHLPPSAAPWVPPATPREEPEACVKPICKSVRAGFEMNAAGEHWYHI